MKHHGARCYCCRPRLTLWFSSTRNSLTWLLTRFLVIRDQPEDVPWFSINVEADRELAGGKIDDKVRVPIRWEVMENEIINMRGSHKTAASQIATKLLFKVCLSLFFLSPPGLLFLEGQMEFARKCQVLFCFSQRLFCFSHRRGWVFNDNSKPKTV